MTSLLWDWYIHMMGDFLALSLVYSYDGWFPCFESGIFIWWVISLLWVWYIHMMGDFLALSLVYSYDGWLPCFESGIFIWWVTSLLWVWYIHMMVDFLLWYIHMMGDFLALSLVYSYDGWFPCFQRISEPIYMQQHYIEDLTWVLMYYWIY